MSEHNDQALNEIVTRNLGMSPLTVATFLRVKASSVVAAFREAYDLGLSDGFKIAEPEAVDDARSEDAQDAPRRVAEALANESAMWLSPHALALLLLKLRIHIGSGDAGHIAETEHNWLAAALDTKLGSAGATLSREVMDV